MDLQVAGERGIGLPERAALPQALGVGATGSLATSWGNVVVATLAMLATVAVASEAWSDLLQYAYGDEESSHVLLAPAVFLWLAWIRRHRLKGLACDLCWVGSAILTVGAVLWASGYRYQIQSFWHGGAVLMAIGAFVTFVGGRAMLALLPAFGALVFMVPVPSIGRQLIAIPMQEYTAALTQVAAETLGILMARQGNLLMINGKEVAIVEACNGMRMVFTLLLACYVFAFVTPLRPWVRLTVLILSPVVAVVANVTRLVPTVWMYGNTSESAAALFHDASGWAMLVIAFLALTGIVRVLEWAEVPVLRSPSRPPSTDAVNRDVRGMVSGG